MNEVEAEARRLEILFATPETNAAVGIERPEASIEFDAVGAKLSVPELNAHVAFGDRGVGLAVAVLAVRLNFEVRRCSDYLLSR